MRVARLSRQSVDGVEPRIAVASSARPGSWIDVRFAELLRHERSGATTVAARRLAAAIVPGSLTAALENGEAFLEAARRAAEDSSGDAVIAEQAELLAPADPPAYRDFMVFEQHFVTGARLSGRDPARVLYELPISYLGSSQAIVGPEAEIRWPSYSREIDYELELGIVIARAGSDLTPDEALDHVLGVTILNDFSARDIQRREMEARLGPSKGKHFATAIGPVIVTLDELDHQNLRMQARINGESWSDGSTSTMLWSVAEMVAWASAAEPMAAGTLFGTGTVGGGCGLELQKRLQPGDVVELEIAGIGVLRNRVTGYSEPRWTPEPKQPRVWQPAATR